MSIKKLELEQNLIYNNKEFNKLKITKTLINN